MAAGQVQIFVSSLLKESPSTIDEPFVTALNSIFAFSSYSCDINSTIQLDSTTTLTHNKAVEFNAEFCNFHLQTVLHHLWSLYTPTQTAPLAKLLLSAVSNCHPSVILSFLTENLKHSTFAIQRDLAENLLDRFLVDRRGTRHLLEAFSSGKLCESELEEVLGLLLALPSLVANAFQGESRPCRSLQGEEFVTCVLTDWIQLVNMDPLSEELECILAYFLGRMCMTGYGNSVWDLLVPITSSKPESWVSKFRSVLQRIPSRFTDSTLQPLFLKSYSADLVYRCLGNHVDINVRLISLFRKLVFLRHYSDINVLHNIFGYLRLSSPLKCSQQCLPLVKVWADKNAIRSTPYDQQLYITSALIICVALMSEEQLKSIESEAVAELLPGVSAHLESPLGDVRLLGMVAGEYLTCRWNLSEEGSVLKFEYEETDNTRLLKSLFVPRKFDRLPTDFSISSLPEALQKMIIETENVVSTTEETSKSSVISATEEEELDSDDDDFKPMPMDKDLPLQRGKEPRYIRDCMDGLLLSKPEDMDTFSACVGAAEQLVYKHRSSVAEVVLEFARIMLHCTPQCHIENFTAKRHRILLALVFVCPKQLGRYLCAEFYQPHYSLVQRMDMLQVLADGANKLSLPDQRKPEPAVSTVKIREITPDDTKSTEKSWKEVIDERLEKKTRRFSKGVRNPPAPETLNKFAPCAGYFFFDLMKMYDHCSDGSFDLIGRDYMVFSRLLYTLGIIYHAADNAPILPKMTSTLLDFLWSVRCHPEPSVRRGILFALCMVFITCPGYFLFPQLDLEIQEWRYWIDGTRTSDSDAECRELAQEAMALLARKYQEVVTAVTDE